MADRKISQLTNLTGADLADVDEFAVVDASATETKAITFGELKTALDTSTGFVRITGDTMTGGLTVPTVDINGGTIDGTVIGGTTPAAADVTSLDLAAIAASIADTAVDVFVYDTSKDSDGGAWRKRTQHTSWYNETLNTSTRGSRREFPAVAVIVAETNKVTIYDGDDPSLPMWMVFNPLSGANITTAGNVNAVSMVNGLLSVGQTGGGYRETHFIHDTFSYVLTSTDNTAQGVVNRNTANLTVSGGSRRIADNTVNDVAMTVLPNAPIDAATGLPVPTIAVATDGGVSVIKDDGTVVDITFNNDSYEYVDTVDFLSDNKIIFGFDNPPNQRYTKVYTIPSADSSGSTFNQKGDADEFYEAVGFGDGPSANADLSYAYSGAEYTPSLAGRNIGHISGITKVYPNEADPSKGMVAQILSDYNTGWMNGDIKGAFLSDTDDTDLVGGTDADRSVNGNDLTVNGTITRTPVATGADLVAYSGFSTSNYLEQPYNSDLDFGTGDFCIMGWLNGAGTSGAGAGKTIFARRDPAGATPWLELLILNQDSNGVISFSTNTSIQAVTSASKPSTGAWSFFCLIRDGGQLKLYFNGQLEDSAANSDNLSNSLGEITVGVRNNAGTITTPLAESFIALLRISATAPTAEQIKKIYEDEKFLFQENAGAVLAGTSDAVTALAYDDDTQELLVGTSQNTSVFRGLRRVETISGSASAISASNGLRVIED